MRLPRRVPIARTEATTGSEPTEYLGYGPWEIEVIEEYRCRV
jgi:hypothetical protein